MQCGFQLERQVVILAIEAAILLQRELAIVQVFYVLLQLQEVNHAAFLHFPLEVVVILVPMAWQLVRIFLFSRADLLTLNSKPAICLY